MLVSEVMLQQTQVDRVIPKWHAFLDRFPDPSTCAAAPVGAVIEAWAGLGYNRRGVALHRCAVTVVDDHGGRLPLDLTALLALPGIGPYTARAVLAFAGERDVAVVDTNVARILARQAGRPLRGAEVQAAADAVVPAGQGWAWNQAMLDLGAGVCRARRRVCGVSRDPDLRVAGRPGAGPGGRLGRACPGASPASRARTARAGADWSTPSAGAPSSTWPPLPGWPDDPERAARVADTLVADGLAVLDGDTLVLP